MSNFQGDYLRILTPETIDGMNLAYHTNGQPKYSEQHAPLASKRFFEQENKTRPTQLKHILEEVHTGFGITNSPQPTQTKVKIR